MESEEIIIITQGEIVSFDIFLEKSNGYPRPIDLTNFDSFKVCLPTEAGGFLEITEVPNANNSVAAKIAPDTNGQINVMIGGADSLLLKLGYGQDIDIEWDNSVTPNTKRKKIAKALNVVSSNCSS